MSPDVVVIPATNSSIEPPSSSSALISPDAWAATRNDIRSSRGAARRSAAAASMYARIRSRPATARAGSARSPGSRSRSSPNQASSCGWSASGKPNHENIVVPGSGRARSRAKSARPVPSNASMSSTTFRRTIGSNRVRSADGLKASRRAPRNRVWTGGSTPAMSPAGRNSW